MSAKKLDRLPMPKEVRVDGPLGRKVRLTAATDERFLNGQIIFLLRLGLKLREAMVVQYTKVVFRQLLSGAR